MTMMMRLRLEVQRNIWPRFYSVQWLPRDRYRPWTANLPHRFKNRRRFLEPSIPLHHLHLCLPVVPQQHRPLHHRFQALEGRAHLPRRRPSQTRVPLEGLLRLHQCQRRVLQEAQTWELSWVKFNWARDCAKPRQRTVVPVRQPEECWARHVF